MNILNKIRQDKNFILKNNVYVLNHYFQYDSFESIYLKLRKKEDRLYDDETLSRLPDINVNHLHYKEWRIRENSAAMLLKYLKEKSHPTNVLEMGCGNGWLANKIGEIESVNVIGLDLNLTELEQAARVFGNRNNLLFLAADIFDARFNSLTFDYIILSASIQYFKNIKIIIKRLFELLNNKGEIHILDSPFYTEQNFQKAIEKSLKHFKEMGVNEFSSYFHFHKFNELSGLNAVTLYKPDSLINRIKRKLLFRNLSPFYWFKIINNN